MFIKDKCWWHRVQALYIEDIVLYLESLLLWNRNSLLFYQFCHLAQYRKFLSMVNHVQAESIDSWVCPGVGVIVKCFIVLLQKWSQWIRCIVCIDRDWNTINYGHAERIRNLGSFLYLCYLDLWTTFPVVNPVHVFVAYWALSLSLSFSSLSLSMHFDPQKLKHVSIWENVWAREWI